MAVNNTQRSQYAKIAIRALNADTASYFSGSVTAVIDTSSLLITASAAGNTITFTKGNGSTFPVTVAGGTGTPGGLDTQLQFNSASVFSGSGNLRFDYVNNTIHLTGSISASLGANTIGFFGTSSWAVSSSRTISASYVLSSSYATTASYVLNGGGTAFPYVGIAVITGSLIVSGSPSTSSFNGLFQVKDSDGKITIQTDVSTNGGRNLFDYNAAVALDWGNRTLFRNDGTTALNWSNGVVNDTFNNLSIDWQNRVLYDNQNPPTASLDWSNRQLYYPNGDIAVNYSDNYNFVITGSTTSTLGFTGSLFGTSSWAESASQAISSSYSLSSSYALSASYALSSSYSLSSSYALSASYAFNSTSASYAQTSSYAVNLIVSGGLTQLDYIDFDTASAALMQTARLKWDNGEGTLQLGLGGGNIDLNVGEQLYQYCYNAQGSPLTKGQVVYISSSQGGRIAVKLASATAELGSANTLGFVAEAIDTGAEGWIMTEGSLRGVNTAGFTPGGLIYLSSSAGQYTQTPQQAPLHGVRLGYAQKIDSSTGIIYVKIDNGYELDELHDVKITSDTSGDLLIRSSSLWINSKQLTGSYGLTGSLSFIDGGVTGSLFGTASWANSASQALTASYITGSIFTDTNPALSSSYALTASYSPNFANTNLTFTANRTHTGGGFEYRLFNSGSILDYKGGNQIIRSYDHTLGIREPKGGGNYETAFIQMTTSSLTVAVGDETNAFSLKQLTITTSSLIISSGFIAYDPAINVKLIDSNNTLLYDTLGTGSISWASRQLINGTGDPSLGWDSSTLIANDGSTTHIDWSNIGYMNFTSTTESPITRVLGMDNSNNVYWTSSTAIGGGGSGFPFTGDAIISGSLLISGSGLIVTGSIQSTQGFTGSLFGTASYVSGSIFTSTNPALSASYALTASYVANATFNSTSSVIGNGSATSFNINHGFNTLNLHITVYSASGTYENVYPDIRRINANTASVVFANPPTTNQYIVYISQ